MAEKTGEGTALDAVNAALGVTPEQEAIVEKSEEIVDELTGEETPAGEEGEATGDEDGAAGEEAGDESETEADGTPRERGPDGKFIKKSEAKPAEGEKPGEKPAEKPGEQKNTPDPINDPIPKDLKQETQTRIRSLIDTARTVTAERDEIKQNFDYMVQGVQATGATPAQYGETLSWLAMFNSSDPAQQEKALELVENVADRLATLLGKSRTVSDPLEQHADLKTAVASGKITSEYAREIARNRAKQQFTSELTNTARTEQEQQQQLERETASARAGLSSLEVELRAKDPQYEAKKAILVPALQEAFKKLHPSQWRESFIAAYRNVKVPTAPRPVPKVPANQPLRANKSPAGGGQKAPASGLEAINAALAGMK